jgi:serine/threonine protein kinase/chitodextrinase
VEKKDLIFNYEPLWGSWKIEKLIGEGSYGKVYKIYKELSGEKIFSAAKIISVPNSSHYANYRSISNQLDSNSLNEYFEEVVEDIKKEINMLYKLRGHSNIINIEDYLIEKRTDIEGYDIIIKMEYATSLSEYIQREKITFNKNLKLKLVLDIIEALSVCHNLGIMHRDIKEENIFISDKGVFKLGDFGVSKSMESTVNAATKVGTYSYMAPEVLKGSKYTFNSDIYSIGVVLYKLFNHGRAPYLPQYPQKFNIQDIEKAQALRLSNEKLFLPDDCDKNLGNIILKALSFDSNKRYKNTTEFKNDLIKYINKNKINIDNHNNLNENTFIYEDKKEDISKNKTFKLPIFSTKLKGDTETFNNDNETLDVDSFEKTDKTIDKNNLENNTNKFYKNEKLKKSYIVITALVVISTIIYFMFFSKSENNKALKSSTDNKIVLKNTEVSSLKPEETNDKTTSNDTDEAPETTSVEITDTEAPNETKIAEETSKNYINEDLDPPQDLKISELGGNNVFIYWKASTSQEVVKYNLYCNDELLNDTYPYDTNFRHMDLSGGTKYDYYVKAIDRDGLESVKSDNLVVTTKNDDTPAKPASIKTVEITETSITIDWNTPTGSDGIDRYLIYRNGVYFDEIDSSETKYEYTELESGTTYKLGVESVDNNYNFSEMSNVLSIETK